MYFKEKEDTDLDKEFKSNKKFNINPKYILITLGGIILLIGIIFLIKIITKSDKYFIELLGDENITLYQGNEYVEPGYRGYDQKDNDLTDDVFVENKLDINTIGEYSITYFLKETKVTRNIKIVAKPDTATYIYLYGKTTMYLDVGEEYVEPKCIVFNSSGTDLNNKVKITNNIDNKVAGTYQVIYSVTNEDGISVTAIRIVIVMDSEVTYKLSPNGYTNGSVTINLEILDPYYKYMILPDGNKVTSKTYQYQVSQNGTYKIETYNTKDTKKETNIKIDTIDTVKPSGSCSGYYKDGISYINVSASDNTGISKYALNNQTYTTNNIKYNGELKSANIKIYDNANNQSSISCNLDNKSVIHYEPIFEVRYYDAQKKIIGDANGFSYWISVPEGATDKMPIVVFLHGSGEDGDDYNDPGEQAILWGPLHEIKKHGMKYNAIILHMQAKYGGDGWWTYAPYMIKAIEEVAEEFKADKNRISLAGWSRGAGGVMFFVKYNPNFFSAAVPIGFYNKPEHTMVEFAEYFIKTEVWGFDGNEGYVGQFKKFVAKINELGGSAKYTYLPDQPHNVINDDFSIFREPEYDLINWMTKQVRKN